MERSAGVMQNEIARLRGMTRPPPDNGMAVDLANTRTALGETTKKWDDVRSPCLLLPFHQAATRMNAAAGGA